MDVNGLWMAMVYCCLLLGLSLLDGEINKHIYRYIYINRNFININGWIFWIMLTEPWPSQKKGI